MNNKRISVRVSAGAKTEKVEQISSDLFKVRVSAPPEKGKANERVSELLSQYFKTPKSNVTLVSGQTSRDKIFLIET